MRTHAAARAVTAIAVLVVTTGCRRPPRQDQPTVQTSSAVEVTRSDASTAAPADPAAPVLLEMRNVRLHLEPGIVLDVAWLKGNMISTHPGQPPVFDDPASYVLRVSDGDVSMDMASLTTLMNRHVWNFEGAPVSNVRVTTDGHVLTEKGTLHKVIALPFTLQARVSATDDGRLLLHTQSLEAVGVPAGGLLKFFGLPLKRLVNLKHSRGLEVTGNDIIVAPADVLPPPRMEGRMRRVELVNGALRQVFGSPQPPADAGRPPNYLYFSGSTLRFGRLTMSGADLMLVDADPRDPFDFFPARYRAQLVAGYSKTTPSGGLRTFMPDYDDLTH